MPKSRISNVANMPFNVIRENKILAKISEFTACIINWDTPGTTSHQRSSQISALRRITKVGISAIKLTSDFFLIL